MTRKRLNELTDIPTWIAPSLKVSKNGKILTYGLVKFQIFSTFILQNSILWQIFFYKNHINYVFIIETILPP